VFLLISLASSPLQERCVVGSQGQRLTHIGETTMTVRYYKHNRNARAAARRAGLDPDTVVQPAPAGFYSVDFGDIEPTEPEPQGEPNETVGVEPQPEESAPEPDESAPIVESTEVDVALANAHLDGIPAFLQRAPESAEETATREERLAHYAKDASPERELVVRKTSAPAPEAKPTKISAVIEKARTVGITMAEVKAMTGWSKTGGFYGAIKRAGLTLTKDAGGVYHAA
jgi:hypothetical protein